MKIEPAVKKENSNFQSYWRQHIQQTIRKDRTALPKANMAENKLGVQTRSMADAQRTEGENPNEAEHQQIQVTGDNPEIV